MAEDNHAMGTWESWLQGSRLVLPSGWFEQQVISASHTLRQHGWTGLEVIYVKERTSWFERTVLFKLRGDAYSLRIFQEEIYKLTEPC